MNKFPKIIVLLFFIARLSGAVGESTAVIGARIVVGKLNETNSVVITMTFGDTDPPGAATTYNGGFCRVWTAYDPSANAPSNFSLITPGIGVGSLEQISGGQCVINLTASNILDDMAQRNIDPIHGASMDFVVKYYDSNLLGIVRV